VAIDVVGQHRGSVSSEHDQGRSGRQLDVSAGGRVGRSSGRTKGCPCRGERHTNGKEREIESVCTKRDGEKEEETERVRVRERVSEREG
jgi:hypothetical protein